MRIDDLLKHTSEWLKGTGPNSNIVISSRIRLARNLSGLPFSHWAGKKQKEESLETIKGALQTSQFLKKATSIDISSLSSIDKQFLVERHLMSREHAANPELSALLFDDKEIVSIMINEEDHIRMQVMQSGFNLTESWRITNEIDTELGARLNYAFSSKLGYLTACPTNVGTGIRASVMLHLPALVLTNQANRVLQTITKLGLTIRGFYGEGTEVQGNFFQISNQVTLGRSEEEIIDGIERVINQIVSREESARKTMFMRSKEKLIDRIWRSYGTLRSAHIISSNETIELLSVIRLGVDMDIIKDITIPVINELFILTQPAHLQKMEKKVLSPQERDLKRAEIIREKLGG
ncbi:MAG: protein arginine kinase [Candidatus Omnitrophica bacterium]|nr:protein arginine kinase [Candidatus Omnitrophota bacterium]